MHSKAVGDDDALTHCCTALPESDRSHHLKFVSVSGANCAMCYGLNVDAQHVNLLFDGETVTSCKLGQVWHHVNMPFIISAVFQECGFCQPG